MTSGPEELFINPLLHREMTQAMSDMARGIDPTSVMGTLLAERKRALSYEEVMGNTGIDSLTLDRTLAMLEECGWAIHFQEDGFDKYIIRGVVRD